MPQVIGIRREDKNPWEARAPFTPEQVAALVAEGLEVHVAPSELRTFPIDAYEGAGAIITDDMGPDKVVFGIKEMPLDHYHEGGVYVIFSHTIKAQPYNMPMLKRIMDQGATLIDYELITGDQGRRLVFFGRYAGLAGMIDTLWSLGERLAASGFEDTAFGGIKQALTYGSLDEAKAAVTAAGERIAADGLPEGLGPFVVGFTGYGNVSGGAQEIFDLLPHEAIAPKDLARFMTTGRFDDKKVYKVVFKEEDMAARKDGRPFELGDYYAHPEKFEGTFGRHLPHLSVLMNCIYWDERYPRLADKASLEETVLEGKGRLLAVGDISCDVDGAVQCTVACTTPGDPTYVYDPRTGETVPGFEGEGVVVMAVDNLPCELPADASRDFGAVLSEFAGPIARCDFTKPLEELELPAPIERAIIVHRGALVERFAHLADHLPR